MRVNLSTSSDSSYAVGGYFVGVLPWWFALPLVANSKSPLYQQVKCWCLNGLNAALPVDGKTKNVCWEQKNGLDFRPGHDSQRLIDVAGRRGIFEVTSTTTKVCKLSSFGES
jgi:hypothetical protein